MFIKNSVLAIIMLSASFYANAQVKEIKVDSKIEHVTVFLRGAQIERSAKKSLTKGVYYLNIEGLSNNLNPNSVQVGGKGNFTILSVSNRKNYLNASKDSPKAKMLRDSILILQDNLWYQRELKAVYQQEKNMLLANKEVSSRSATGFQVSNVEGLANLYRKRLTELMKLNMDITRKEKKYQERIRVLQNQINQLSVKSNYTSEVIVEVGVNQNTSATFDLKYMVNGASWAPTYDIRANGVDKPMELSYNAKLIQNTGIDWKSVDLSLSTNNPYVSPIKPTLSPWRLNFINNAYKKRELSGVSNRRTDYGTNQAIVLSEDAESDKMLSKPNAGQTHQWTTVTESDLNYSFDISIPYNIPSDNKKHNVNVRKMDLNTSFGYFTVPKKKTEAFLVGSVPDWEKLQLMSGSANIYLDGTFVGQSYIDTKNTKDTLQISLGIDKQIIVSRKRIQDFCKVKMIGSNKTETIGLEVNVRNTKMQAIKIIVEEQIPISSNSEIIVELLEKSKAKYNEKTGFLTWELELAPGESKSLVFKYSVKFPKDRTTNL